MKTGDLVAIVEIPYVVEELYCGEMEGLLQCVGKIITYDAFDDSYLISMKNPHIPELWWPSRCIKPLEDVCN